MNDQLKKSAYQIVITVGQDGRVEVIGFPVNYNAAMQIMGAGTARVAQHFVNKARDGEVDDNLNLQNSRIIKPKIKVKINPRSLH